MVITHPLLQSCIPGIPCLSQEYVLPSLGASSMSSTVNFAVKFTKFNIKSVSTTIIAI